MLCPSSLNGLRMDWMCFYIDFPSDDFVPNIFYCIVSLLLYWERDKIYFRCWQGLRFSLVSMKMHDLRKIVFYWWP